MFTWCMQSLESLVEIEVCSTQNLVEVGSWIKRHRCIGGTTSSSPTVLTDCHVLLSLPVDMDVTKCYPYYNLPYNPSAPFVRSGFLVSYRILSAVKVPQNVLHSI